MRGIFKMKVVNDFRGHYDDSLERHYKYEKFGDESETSVFLHGDGCIQNCEDYFESYKDCSKRVAFNYEHPSGWQTENLSAEYAKRSADTEKFFHAIYTVCPYTADWLNANQGEERFVASCHPFELEDAKTEDEDFVKEYDALYWGGIHHQDHIDIVDIISKYKYNFITLGYEYWPVLHGYENQKRYHTDIDYYHKINSCIDLITKVDIPRKEMWDTIRKTKITITNNLLYCSEAQAAAPKKLEGWEKNRAFDHLDDRIVPQLKTRVIESAFNKSLLLVKRDPWNVIEYWFEPDKDFIYYEDKKDLADKVEEISTNWEKYRNIPESAYKKSIENYTTKHLLSKICKEG